MNLVHFTKQRENTVSIVVFLRLELLDTTITESQVNPCTYGKKVDLDC